MICMSTKAIFDSVGNGTGVGCGQQGRRRRARRLPWGGCRRWSRRLHRRRGLARRRRLGESRLGNGQPHGKGHQHSRKRHASHSFSTLGDKDAALRRIGGVRARPAASTSSQSILFGSRLPRDQFRSPMRRRSVLPVLFASALLATSAACGDNSNPNIPTPTPTPGVTETFPGSINTNGAMTFPFTVATGGFVTATLTSIGPDSTTLIGISIGTYNGGVCTVGVGMFSDKTAQGSSHPRVGVLGRHSVPARLRQRRHAHGRDDVLGRRRASLGQIRRSFPPRSGRQTDASAAGCC